MDHRADSLCLDTAGTRMEATLGSGTPDSGIITGIAIDPVRRGNDGFTGDSECLSL
jgi:hypothetical protein